MAYDNIEIGQLMTERYVEDTGLIRSDSFNRLYDLKLRSDLIYNDTGVKNTPNDTIDSHVFEVIQSLQSNMDVTFYRDAVTSIDIELRKIIAGEHYSFDRTVQIAGSGTVYLGLEMADKNCNFVFEVIANDFGIEFMTYEDVALGNVITPFIPINNNRNVSNVSTITIGQYDSVDLTDSLLIVHNIIGTSTNPVKGSGGTISRGNANLLKLNTQYAMKIINLSTKHNNINIKLGWCEEA